MNLGTLRCDRCAHLEEGFCNKLDEDMHNRLAKLFFGGAVELFPGTRTYPSECGIEKEEKSGTRVNIEVFASENLTEKL